MRRHWSWYARRMLSAAHLAGSIAAHAIWCVSDQDGLVPMLAFTTEGGERKLERLVDGDAAAAVEHGRKRLEDDPLSADDGVLAYDGYVTVDGQKTDAIILELRCYAFPAAKAAIAVPYTPASSGRFRVHKPRLLLWEGCEDFDGDAAFASFFDGVESHEHGAKAWTQAFSDAR